VNRAPVHRIVVGVDGSEPAARALGWAIEVAGLVDAELVAVHAHQLPQYVPRPGGASCALDAESWERSVREDFERSWCAPLEAAGVRHRTVFETGPAGEVLLRVAGALVADLIVTGHRGRGELVDLVAGSVSQRMVHRAPCPVVVVPPGRPEAA